MIIKGFANRLARCHCPLYEFLPAVVKKDQWSAFFFSVGNRFSWTTSSYYCWWKSKNTNHDCCSNCGTEYNSFMDKVSDTCQRKKCDRAKLFSRKESGHVWNFAILIFKSNMLPIFQQLRANKIWCTYWLNGRAWWENIWLKVVILELSAVRINGQPLNSHIKFVILLTVNHTILIMLVQRI